uniref:F-box domain-containing protein n=1 Tax=Steinernema glaseri TaxID=37863 RepID=A0A1I8AGE0_9BILA
MEFVPRTFIESVLCISKLSRLPLFQQLRSVQWSRSATVQLSRRQNWNLGVFLAEDGGLSVILDDSSDDDPRWDPTVASLEEFVRKDPRFHQITSIWFDHECDDVVLLEASDPSQWTHITSAMDVKKCFRRILGRINFGALDCLCLRIIDSVGLHSTILEHLLDNDAKTRELLLAYQGPASTEFLRRHVHKNELTKLHLCEGWPLEGMVPLVEALVQQKQLQNFSTDTRMNPGAGLEP